MKNVLTLVAITGTLGITACASTPFTFAALDEDQNGFVSLADVAKADKYVPLQSLAAFDTDGDAQMNPAEFEAYLSSDVRQAARNAALEEQRIRQVQQQTRTVGGGGGSYGS